MSYNFNEFKGGGRRRTKEGLTVSKYVINISEKDFKFYSTIGIYLDLKKNAIKITEGDTYKISTYDRKDGSKFHTFSGALLVKKGLKLGRYKFIGNNIFVLEVK